MILLDWYREFLNIRLEYNRERSEPCESCENLKIQLEAANMREQKLIEALVNKDKVIVEAVPTTLPQALKPRHVSWRVKQQHLEAESRQAASLLKKKLDEMKAPSGGIHVTAPATEAISTEELEKELDLVETEREHEHGERSGTE